MKFISSRAFLLEQSEIKEIISDFNLNYVKVSEDAFYY